MLDVDIINTEAPVALSDTSGIIGGSPRNDPKMDDGLKWPGLNYWYHESMSVDVST